MLLGGISTLKQSFICTLVPESKHRDLEVSDSTFFLSNTLPRIYSAVCWIPQSIQGAASPDPALPRTHSS